MMLLNNDYYLDMKQSLMSQEISTLISNTDILKDVLTAHVLDTSIHGARGVTEIKNYYTTIVSGETESSVNMRYFRK